MIDTGERVGTQQPAGRQAEELQSGHGAKHDEALDLSTGDSKASNWLLRKWENLPPQYQLVFASAWAFVICNMVRHQRAWLRFRPLTHAELEASQSE